MSRTPHPSRLSTPEVDTIQAALRTAMVALDACGQDDLSDAVKAVFKTVAERAFSARKVGDLAVDLDGVTPIVWEGTAWVQLEAPPV